MEDQSLRRRFKRKDDPQVLKGSTSSTIKMMDPRGKFSLTSSRDYFDDKTGCILDGKLVMAAEREEVEFMEKLGVGEDSTEEECWRLTGKAPIDTMFVRVNKGSDDKPEVRARLVATGLQSQRKRYMH